MPCVSLNVFISQQFRALFKALNPRFKVRIS